MKKSMIDWWRFSSTLRRFERLVPERGTFFYQDLDGVATGRRPREEIIVDLCRGKSVLHFGFTDAPLTRERLAGGNLLHTRILGCARLAYGLDIDAEAMEIYREITGDGRFSILDIESDNAPVPPIDERFDVILFGETLEHLRNPGMALTRLRALCEKSPGSILVLTVPNAFSAMGFVAASGGVEVVHPEHYAYYSPVTLRNLLTAHGFADIRLTMCPYHDHGVVAPGVTQDCVLATATFPAAAAAPAHGAGSGP
jgi:SAM-dependent methyltransferase